MNIMRFFEIHSTTPSFSSLQIDRSTNTTKVARSVHRLAAAAALVATHPPCRPISKAPLPLSQPSFLPPAPANRERFFSAALSRKSLRKPRPAFWNCCTAMRRSSEPCASLAGVSPHRGRCQTTVSRSAARLERDVVLVLVLELDDI